MDFNYKVSRNVIVFYILLSTSPICNAESWTPKPNFNIEGSNLEMTLTFISGIAYALYESERELKKQNKPNFYCNNTRTIDSRLLIDILNQDYIGSISSENAIEAILTYLKITYPCES